MVDSILESVWSGREDSTVNKYCLSLRKILSFRKEKNYPPLLPFSSAFAAEYLTHLKLNDSKKGATEISMAALKWVHSFIPGINHWNNPMNDDFLGKIVSSIKRNTVKVKDQKSPLTGEMIRLMVEKSNLEDVVQLRNCLVLSFSYSLLLRHDEISHITLDHFTEMENGYKIFIPKSKTDSFRNGNHVFLKKSVHPSSISQLLGSYLSKFNLSLGENHFLFFPIHNGKRASKKLNQILSYASFRDIFKKMVTLIGLNPSEYGTHSGRSGGASDLAPFVTEHELLTSGRWKDARSIRSYVEMEDESRLSINAKLQNNICGGSLE